MGIPQTNGATFRSIDRPVAILRRKISDCPRRHSRNRIHSVPRRCVEDSQRRLVALEQEKTGVSSKNPTREAVPLSADKRLGQLSNALPGSSVKDVHLPHPIDNRQGAVGAEGQAEYR